MWDFIAKYWLETVFGVIVAALTAAYGVLAKRIKANRDQDKAIADGVKYLLMFQLREEGEKYLADGRCGTEQKHEYEKVYNAYHALGGNDTITELKGQILRLPPN